MFEELIQLSFFVNHCCCSQGKIGSGCDHIGRKRVPLGAPSNSIQCWKILAIKKLAKSSAPPACHLPTSKTAENSDKKHRRRNNWSATCRVASLSLLNPLPSVHQHKLEPNHVATSLQLGNRQKVRRESNLPQSLRSIPEPKVRREIGQPQSLQPSQDRLP